MVYHIAERRAHDISNDEIARRWWYSYNSKAEFDDMYDTVQKALFLFEKHLQMDEVWGEAFRFPELIGVAYRKYSNLIEVLPENRVRSNSQAALSMQAAIESEKTKSNLAKVRYHTLWDSICFGHGVEMVVPTEFYRAIRTDDKVDYQLAYRGIGAEKIDPRDFIPAYSAMELHDHTGKDFCPYAFRRRIYYYDSFVTAYGNLEGYNQEKIRNIKPVPYDSAFASQSRISTKEESIHQQQGQDYVIVLEYWDPVNDVFRVFANDFVEGEIYNSAEGIPFSHKQLPFHFYYNYKRNDSIFGISEIALNMPYNQFKEQMMNLQIDNAWLELNPAYIIDGNINFNDEEHELSPGAIFNVRGVVGGKLQDHIMPFRAGGITADIPGVVDLIESSQIAVTGDDFRSLYVNPNQLATQTLSKREALQKRTRTNIIENTVYSEYYLHCQLASYIKNELAEPYKDAEGKTQYQKILVKGFDVDQARPSDKIRVMSRKDGAESEFYLNKKVTKDFDFEEIEVIPASLDEQLKRDRVEKLIMFLQEIFSLVQTPQGAKLLESLDLNNFIKQVALNLGLNVSELLPNLATEEMPSGIEDKEYDMIAKGQTPPVQADKYDPVQRYLGTLDFMKSSVYKNLAGASKAAFEQFQTNLLSSAQGTNETNPTETVAGAIETPTGTRDEQIPGSTQGFPQ